ncbi:GNAT family N-acetyltransferase [Alteromonas aestuariivivens]|uniref:GNAT family N-acetyltransferase n=1 Tax=Alteromonas aestuariivivens TaxID=1938339 RepID=A0A3D8M3G8_9ALTE|nr:GNAT family N-acetyltransferase [Alteromonas aestuariivivens]RDV24239.1 GNAT family N-acetyltransferase [Alteromonas aestuariivivens]
MPMLHIRPATPEDAGQILDFILELAIYEKARHEVEATVEDIKASLFAPNATAHCVICEESGQAIGFAVYFYNYSTWQGRNGVYLEDLYVSQQHRGKGAGKALLHYLANHAVEHNCGRFEWSVLDWNTPAIEFYQSLGAKPKDEWIGYRLSGDALNQFAAIPTNYSV